MCNPVCWQMASFTEQKLYLRLRKCLEWVCLFSSVQSISCVWLFATPWITACQASLSITNSRSSLRLASIESVMPSSHLILCRPFLLLPSIFPRIRVFSNESFLRISWPKYWSFNFSISPSNGKKIKDVSLHINKFSKKFKKGKCNNRAKENKIFERIFFRIDWLDLLAVQGTIKSLL